LFFYLILIPEILAGIPLLPIGILNRFFILDIHNPTIEQMYLSNFNTSNLSFLILNISVYLFVLFLILLLETNRRRFSWFSILAFCFLPFVNSMVTLAFARFMPGIMTVSGFSSIYYSFVGYLLYLTLDTVYTVFQKADHLAVRIALGLCFVLVILGAITIGSFSSVSAPIEGVTEGVTNGVGHLTGYIAGLTIPVEIY
jgi:hypothetical protein